MSDYKYLRECKDCGEKSRSGELSYKNHKAIFYCSDCITEHWNKFAEEFPTPMLVPSFTMGDYRNLYK